MKTGSAICWKKNLLIAPLTLYKNQVVFWVFSELLKGFSQQFFLGRMALQATQQLTGSSCSQCKSVPRYPAKSPRGNVTILSLDNLSTKTED